MMILFKADYYGYELEDIEEEIALTIKYDSPLYRQQITEKHLDGYGLQKGKFTVTITWEPDDDIRNRTS